MARLAVLMPLIGCGGCDRAQSSNAGSAQRPVAGRDDRSGRVACSLELLRDGVVIKAQVVFANQSDKVISVWKRDVLSEPEMTWNAFEVTRDGEEVDYCGWMVKRSPPTPADCVSVQPGGSLRSEVGLSKYYDLRKRGRYVVRYVGYWSTMSDADGSPQVRSNSCVFENDGQFIESPMRVD